MHETWRDERGRSAPREEVLRERERAVEVAGVARAAVEVDGLAAEVAQRVDRPLAGLRLPRIVSYKGVSF